MPANNQGYIYAPVGAHTVMKVLGEKKADVGSLCTSAKINRWAKYKPVRVDQPNGITEDQRKAVNHGLVPTPALNTAQTAFNLAPWEYNIPDGTWWKRLTDFDGYVHTSKPPIYILTSEADIDDCSVITWDEGTTKIDDFKIVAAYRCANTGVGPPSQFGLSMDDLYFNGVEIKNCTFGLLQMAGTTKMYLGASKKFNYDGQEAPVIDFSTKWASTSTGYNALSNNLLNLPVGSYIEVLPVIDTQTFSANKTGAPSGLVGFPIGKKLRIYHQKTDNWYLTALGDIITLRYISNKSTLATELCGYMSHSASNYGITRKNPSDPANEYYFIETSYQFYNNRPYALTLNNGAFYLLGSNNISCQCQGITTNTNSWGNSVTISANQSVTVHMRFQVSVEEFNKWIVPVPGVSVQPMQTIRFCLAFKSPSNIITCKNTNGDEISETWLYKTTVNS